MFIMYLISSQLRKKQSHIFYNFLLKAHLQQDFLGLFGVFCLFCYVYLISWLVSAFACFYFFWWDPNVAWDVALCCLFQVSQEHQ